MCMPFQSLYGDSSVSYLLFQGGNSANYAYDKNGILPYDKNGVLPYRELPSLHTHTHDIVKEKSSFIHCQSMRIAVFADSPIACFSFFERVRDLLGCSVHVRC